MLTENRAGTVEDKKALRKHAASIRAQLHSAYAKSSAEAILRRGMELLGPSRGRVVAGFHAFRSEVDVMPLLDALARSGWPTALPVIVEHHQPLIFRKWSPGDGTTEGHFGIHAPHEHAEAIEPDVLLVPMLAFDREGYRLGYGGGFYDRTLERLRRMKEVTAIGIAFAGQEMAEVPRSPEDQPMDWILTDEGPIYPKHEELLRGAECV